MTVSRIRLLVLIFWALAGAWFFLVPGRTWAPPDAPAGTDASGRPLYWYKGNTHSHANLTFEEYSHGDSSPEEVAGWYRDHGYHFVAITDHNQYTAAVDLPRADTGFLVIPGMEVTSDFRYPGVNGEGERQIHATALNVREPVAWDFENAEKASIIDLQAGRVEAAGGLHILNHPNYRFQVELADILGAKNVRLIELYNAHPRSNPLGHAGFRPSVEELWDQVLGGGRLLYGVAVDDAHDFDWPRRLFRQFGASPPGGGWIMVRAPALTSEDILTAMLAGDFYASTGVHLKNVRTEGGRYHVELDRERTLAETGHSWVRNAAPVVWSDDTHFVIEFIGRHGLVLHATHDLDSAEFPLEHAQGYMRARVTYLEMASRPLDKYRARAYYAWTQPVMITATSSGQ